jgi:hypothetical protein
MAIDKLQSMRVNTRAVIIPLYYFYSASRYRLNVPHQQRMTHFLCDTMKASPPVIYEAELKDKRERH